MIGRLNRVVHRVMPEAEEKRLLLLTLRLNVIDGLGCHRIGQVITGLPFFHVGNFVGCKKGPWATHSTATDIQIKALLFGQVLSFLLVPITSHQVPLADKSGGVASLLECFGNGFIVSGEVVERFARPHGLVAIVELPAIRQMISDLHSAGRQASNGSCPGWRTDGGSCVGIGKTHSLFRQAVNVRCRELGTSLAVKVHPSQIINHDKKNIGLFGGNLISEIGCPQDGE